MMLGLRAQEMHPTHFHLAEHHHCAAELQSLSGAKPAEVQDAVCSKAMAVCGVVARYGAVSLPDGKPASVDAFLAPLIRQALPCLR